MPLGKAAKYGFLSARCHTIRAQLIDHERLKELAASRSIGELASALAETPYAPFISTVSAEGIHHGLSRAFEHQRHKLIRSLKKKDLAIFNLFFVTKYTLLDDKTAQTDVSNPEESFRQIDKEYIGALKVSMLRLPLSERRQLKMMVGSYFDLLNLYNLVKSRLLYHQSVEETLSFMLPYAAHFKIDELAQLCSAESLQALSRRIQPVLGEGFDDYEAFRKVLYRYHRSILQSVWSGYPFSIALPFSLLRLIEIAILDLRAITEGVSFGLGRDEIMAMTVGE